MAIEQRIKGKLTSPGPYIAEVTNHLDTSFMGGLEVSLVKTVAGLVDVEGETYPVKYLSPFAGTSSLRFEGPNPGSYNDVQKSYGFWMVPPDIGTRVMVVFVDGDLSQGYWFGCINDTFQNYMIPGIASSRNVLLTEDQKRKYGTDNLPVAEFHKRSQTANNPNVNSILKPIHPFADRLLQQGLLLDTVRGITSSSARREVPSNVFGISTPGPLDNSDGARKGRIGYKNNSIEVPISRLGGTTFVMDDGDSLGENELVRLRTRTGHQILLHNSHDLIYIANSKGTAWIELTSNGKIDIFAQDSVSIHTEKDFNFRADRDINLEAGRNINIKAEKNMETNVLGYYHLIVDDYSKIHIKNDYEKTVGKNSIISIGENFELNVKGNNIQTSEGSNETKAGGNIIETASKIHMNGPEATNAKIAEIPPYLPLFNLPNRLNSKGWVDGKFYKAEDLKSIMLRVPTHEPWPQHENINNVQFSAEATDITLADRTASGIPPNPTSAAGSSAPIDPITGEQPVQEPANPPSIMPGTCDSQYAKDINNSASQDGINNIKEACNQLGITSPNAIAAMLGIVGGECLWKLQNESFNYRADRLLQVFPSVFKGNKNLAQQYAGNPGNSLPEFLYGYQSKKGQSLGNIEPGDGLKFIGRGYIQLTGRSNYTRYSKLMYEKGLLSSPTELVNKPDLLSNSKIAAQVAVLYMLDRVKVSQTDQGYFESACVAVGYNTTDIKARKQGYYECFLAQLRGNLVSTGSKGILVDSQGNPITTGNFN